MKTTPSDLVTSFLGYGVASYNGWPAKTDIEGSDREACDELPVDLVMKDVGNVVNLKPTKNHLTN